MRILAGGKVSCFVGNARVVPYVYLLLNLGLIGSCGCGSFGGVHAGKWSSIVMESSETNVSTHKKDNIRHLAPTQVSAMSQEKFQVETYKLQYGMHGRLAKP